MTSKLKLVKSKFTPFFMAILFLGAQVTSTLAVSLINSPMAEAVSGCVNDTAGANDEPGQKDLTRLCVDETGLPSTMQVTWNWDELGTSGNNTMDACGLFDDNDADLNADYSICIITENTPATIQDIVIYSCGNGANDKCTQQRDEIAGPYQTTCTVNQQNTDPFPAGTSNPSDTVAMCTFYLADLDVQNLTDLELTDVCSYPSSIPGSDPSDCVIIQTNPVALVEVVKDIVPDGDTGLFDLSVNGPGADDTTVVNDRGDNGTTGIVAVTPINPAQNSIVTVSETAGTGTNLASYSSSISCVDRGTTNVVGSSQTTSAQFTVQDGDDVVCTITNTKAGSITITKNAIANSLQDFGFTTNGTGVSNFTLDDDSGVVGADATNSNSKTFNNLGAGTYTFTETALNGWYLDSIDCPNISETQDLNTRQVSLTITAGQNVSCTFTNRQLGEIKVTKQTNPNNDPTQFAISASPSNGVVGSANQNITDNQTITYTVKHGTYSVAETVPAGWTETSNNCSSLTIDGNTPLVNGVPTLSCTINNTKYSSVTFVKDAVPNGPQDFVFGTSTNLSGFILDDDSDSTRSNQQQFTNLLPGTYSAEEIAVTGWDLTDMVCTGLGASYDTEGSKIVLDLGAGQNITCTFTNTQRASISGQKFEDVNGNGTWDAGEPTLNDWNIWIDLNDNGVYDDGVDQSMLTVGDGTYLFDNILPGSYSVFEVLQDGWVQTLQPSEVVLDAGELQTGVNFGNFENNTISGYKWNDIDGNAQKGENEPKLGGWTINLLNDGDDDDSLLDDIVQTKVTDQNGNYSFTNVLKGSYLVCEVAQNGWYQTYPLSNSCHSITVDTSGEVHSNVNFGNQGRGSITVKKDVDTDGDGDIEDINSAEWTFDIDGSGNYATGSTINNVAAGSHIINEDQKTDYHFVSVICTGQRQVTQSESFNITVNPGDNITCTFTNARDTGEIKVIKYVEPYSDNGYFNLLIDDNVEASNIQDEGTTGFVKVLTGNHQVSETAGTGTDLDDYISEIYGDCAADGSVTIAKDESKVCYISNTKKAKVTIIKDAYPNHEQDFDFTFGPYQKECEFEFSVLSDENCFESVVPQELTNVGHDFTLDDDDDETLPNTEVIEGIVPGKYFVEEKTVAGWDLYDIYCDYGNDNEYDIASIGETHTNGQYLELEPGADVTCTFVNIKRTKVTIVKDSQPNSSQEFNFSHNIKGEESSEFVLVDDGTGENNSKSFDDLKVGKYGQYFGISENETEKWRVDDFSCDNEQDYREERVQTQDHYYEDGFDYRFWVGPGQDVTCTFVNQELSLNIVKNNNRPQPTVTGDVVTYTLIVTVPEQASKIYDANVIDLPPENFEYVLGSWTANSSERGDIKANNTTPEPPYGSPGEWQIGDLIGGEVVTLTYQAKILNNVTPGIYPDIAFVNGFGPEEQEVLGNVKTADTPFVGTAVAVAAPVATLFVPPTLANTGSALSIASILVPIAMLLLTAFAYKRSRQIPQKGGQK